MDTITISGAWNEFNDYTYIDMQSHYQNAPYKPASTLPPRKSLKLVFAFQTLTDLNPTSTLPQPYLNPSSR